MLWATTVTGKREPRMMEGEPDTNTSPFLAELALVDVIKCLRKCSANPCPSILSFGSVSSLPFPAGHSVRDEPFLEKALLKPRLDTCHEDEYMSMKEVSCGVETALALVTCLLLAVIEVMQLKNSDC